MNRDHAAPSCGVSHERIRGEDRPAENVETSDNLFKIWRFPAMHAVAQGLPRRVRRPEGSVRERHALASNHNFRLKDYIATSTRPKELILRSYGNPVNQIVFTLKPVQGGGGKLQVGWSGRPGFQTRDGS